MIRSIIGVLVMATLVVRGEEAPPLQKVQQLLNQPGGEMGALAKALLGTKGGNQLFYFPTKSSPYGPKDWGCLYEEVRFNGLDQTPLTGWFLKPKVKKPKGLVVFSHGNTGSMGYHLGFVVWMVEAGYQVLMYDYRGFGQSGGVCDRRGMVDDVKAAIAYAKTREDVDPKRVISYGHSLGGAKSLVAVAEAPELGVRAVIVDGAFASYQAMGEVIGGKVGKDMVTDELSPKDYVGRLAPVPLLVVHGSQDEIVPVEQGKRIYQEAKEPKTMYLVENGQHGDSLLKNGGQYRKKMLGWVERCMDGAADKGKVAGKADGKAVGKSAGKSAATQERKKS